MSDKMSNWAERVAAEIHDLTWEALYSCFIVAPGQGTDAYPEWVYLEGPARRQVV